MKFKVHRQLTAALENVPGRLAAICQALHTNNIDIQGICVVDNVEQGVTRIIVNDTMLAKAILMEQNIYVVEAEVIMLEMTDQSDSLARLCAALATENINIDYMYGSFLEIGTRTKVILKVSDTAKAIQILSDLNLG